MKKLFWALLLLLPAAASQAQYDYFGENKIVYDNFDWKIYHSTHFTIYFYDAEKDKLQKVTSYAESAYDERSRQLNFQIPKPINIIYYATHSDFEQTNTLLNFIPEGVGAFALPSRNRMVLPVDLPDEKLQQLIGHELTHVFQFEILFGGNYLRAATTSAPQWFMEGMASYYGNDEDNRDRMVLRDAVLSDQVPEITQKGIEGFFAYRFGHAVFDFIAAEWGKDAVRDFVFEFRIEDRSGYKTEEYISPINGQTYYRQVYVEPEGPDREGRTDRLRRALQSRGHAFGRALAAGVPVGGFRRGHLHLQGRRGRHSDVHAGAQALPEPHERL